MALHIGPGLIRSDDVALSLANERRERERQEQRARWTRTYDRGTFSIDLFRDVINDYLNAGRGDLTRQQVTNDTAMSRLQEPTNQEDMNSNLYRLVSHEEIDQAILDSIYALSMEDEVPGGEQGITGLIDTLLLRIQQPIPMTDFVRKHYVSALLARFLRVAYEVGFDRGNQAASMQAPADADRDFEKATDAWHVGDAHLAHRVEFPASATHDAVFTLRRMGSLPLIDMRDIGQPLELRDDDDGTRHPANIRNPDGSIGPNLMEGLNIRGDRELFPPTQLYQDAGIPGYPSNV